MFADINEQTAKESAEESKKYATRKGYRASYVEVDVTDEEGVQAMVDLVVKEFGSLDYAVNGAGVSNCPGSSLYSKSPAIDVAFL